MKRVWLENKPKINKFMSRKDSYNIKKWLLQEMNNREQIKLHIQDLQIHSLLSPFSTFFSKL
jgi:hypothetical protein